MAALGPQQASDLQGLGRQIIAGLDGWLAGVRRLVVADGAAGGSTWEYLSSFFWSVEPAEEVAGLQEAGGTKRAQEVGWRTLVPALLLLYELVYRNRQVGGWPTVLLSCAPFCFVRSLVKYARGWASEAMAFDHARRSAARCMRPTAPRCGGGGLPGRLCRRSRMPPVAAARPRW